jgi:hypothetical protein
MGSKGGIVYISKGNHSKTLDSISRRTHVKVENTNEETSLLTSNK